MRKSHHSVTHGLVDASGDADRVRLCVRQFGTGMTLYRQAAPGAPREAVASIPLSKWPTPSWIHDFPVTCVSTLVRAAVPASLCDIASSVTRRRYQLRSRSDVWCARRPNYAVVPEQPCFFNLQARAARPIARDAVQPFPYQHATWALVSPNGALTMV